MERLCTVYEDWNPKLSSFGTFAAQPIDWEIRDFLKRLRRQVSVKRSINLNDPADHADVDDDTPPQPERPDVMRLDALQTQATAAKRRFVADMMDCLDLRERRVIEGRLALNGYGYSMTHKALAAELNTSERDIGRIERAAVDKLRRAVL
jgi:RNA polymerase sigma factor (sigma-70 family)